MGCSSIIDAPTLNTLGVLSQFDLGCRSNRRKADEVQLKVQANGL